MHAVVRTYSGNGANELFDVLEKCKADVESAMRTVKGICELLTHTHRRRRRFRDGLR